MALFSPNCDFFCQMIFSECCDLFEICILDVSSSAIWQSSESWPSVARSNASTSIWQWHLGKVFHPRQNMYISKSWKKFIYLCPDYLICSVGEHLSDLLAQVLLWFVFGFFFSSLFLGTLSRVSNIIYRQILCDFLFACRFIFSFVSSEIGKQTNACWVICIVYFA